MIIQHPKVQRTWSEHGASIIHWPTFCRLCRHASGYLRIGQGCKRELAKFCMCQIRKLIPQLCERISYHRAMPATWTTEAQVTFLKAELPGFLAAQCQGHGPRFLKGLEERWFEKWPERNILFHETLGTPLTPEEEGKLSAAIVNRKRVSFHPIKKIK